MEKRTAVEKKGRRGLDRDEMRGTEAGRDGERDGMKGRSWRGWR